MVCHFPARSRRTIPDTSLSGGAPPARHLLQTARGMRYIPRPTVKLPASCVRHSARIWSGLQSQRSANVSGVKGFAHNSCPVARRGLGAELRGIVGSQSNIVAILIIVSLFSGMSTTIVIVSPDGIGSPSKTIQSLSRHHRARAGRIGRRNRPFPNCDFPHRARQASIRAAVGQDYRLAQRESVMTIRSTGTFFLHAIGWMAILFLPLAMWG